MKRKFSLFVTIVVCLLIAAGILSACNEGEKKIASIDFADGEWQTNYYLGEVFEPCVATVTYEDGSTETVAVTPEMVKGFDTSKLGNYNIEITINGVTKVMTITVVEKGEEAHVHSMELTAAKEANCTEGGNNAYYHCSGCNKYFKDEAGMQETTVEAETIPAAGHDYKETVIAPTCTEEGYTLYECRNCDDSYTDNKAAALGHYMTLTEAKDATCTEAGNNAYYHCSRCDKYFKDIEGEEETTVEAETIPATGHNWNNGEITTAATCTTNGVVTYTCLDCGETKTETIPALGHGMTIIEANAATCTEGGNNAYYHCSRCDKYFKDIEGEEETTVEAETIPATGHKWDEGEVTTAATCTEDGAMTYACLNCGETKTETIAAAGHKWDEGEITTAATCTEDGVMIFTCSNCNETKTETIPAGHVIVDGVCTVCGELIYTEGLEYRLSNDKTYYIVTGIGTASGDIIIPDTHEGLSVKEIGDYAFFGCDGLTSIEIPVGVASIGGRAFFGCSNLESVTFAEGSQLTSIGWYAFQDCSSLTSIEIPAGVTSIGYDAFYGCSSLTSIELPAGVTSIGDSAFDGCSNLESVTFAEGSQLTSIGSYAFQDCSNLTSIEIPAGVTSIGSSAFRNCSNLESVTFVEGSQLTSIGIQAFYGCSNLTSIEIPAGSSIGERAFYGCSNLESVTFAEGSGLTSIGPYAFSGCSSLTSIEIPAGVTSIGSYAFSGCSNLASVTFAEGSQLTSIRDRAFYECSSLTSIEIPAGVTSIGDRAFYECSSLTSIEIPAGVSSIGHLAFYYCSSLTSIEIPAGVTSIGDWAFYDCSNLETIYYNDTEEQWIAIEKGVNWDLNCGSYEVVFLGDAGAEA